jgi:hypothetical protein
MDLEALIGSIGQELADKVSKIDENLLVQFTVGSHKAAARVAGMGGGPPLAEGAVSNDRFWNFLKANDGFIRVFAQSPEPPPFRDVI